MWRSGWRDPKRASRRPVLVGMPFKREPVRSRECRPLTRTRGTESLKFVQTSVLEIAYEYNGPRDGSPVMLLHGWPDAPRGWMKVADRLNEEDWRTIVLYLRGSRPTRFLSACTPRFGAGVALDRKSTRLNSSHPSISC